MSAYYNEFDPKTAAWLRELIKRGLIAPGEVDERSIADVQPDDLRGFRQVHLFAGIGGFHAALHAAGGRWAFASEIDPDAAAVYDHNWLRPLRESNAPLPPGVKSFGVSGDIVALTDPEVVGRIEALGGSPLPVGTPAEVDAMLVRETERWARFVRETGLTMQ